MKDRQDEEVPAARIAIPPQPDPGVQETTFAADATSELQVLEHEPLSDVDNEDAQRRGGYGTCDSDSHPPEQSKSTTRALAPDLLRGLLMVLMALDHNAMSLHSWPHGTAVAGEQDSIVVHEWNRPAAFAIRILTHLCAPGFTFLLGMGIVYFGRSRTNLGWPAGRMVRHFFVRAVVLTLITVAMGFAMTGGQLWFMNIILFALAIDYLLAGLLWLVMSRTEQMVAFLLLRILPEKKSDDASEPLLENRHTREEEPDSVAPDRTIIRAADISWHLHNVVLVVLSLVTIWWNIWLSPTGGHCHVEHNAKLPESFWFRIWFYPVHAPGIISGFPPLAWLSFAILGLLYGRIILARSWSTNAIAAGNMLTAAGFSLIFVLTRVLHFGNLSEGCLQMPEQAEHPDMNQYFASVPSFFYLTKYPPDVAFWSFTMAGNLLLLALFSTIPSAFATRAFKTLLVFGTSALFFYTIHIFLLVALALGAIAWLGHSVPGKDPWTGQPGIGVDQLWVFFANWGIALAILYPLCKWYGVFKRTKGSDSIWRFF
ncbi:hypothetical protein B0H66DRAFT_542372 [Apodospora peruviana]|uniref:Heparan-alpha-glucosaminide N-acetyltransferase catalytic domain-containing protein n=1 Tax=Apodospora peruviana TaxID=516989 RepID=A0AAE0IRE0_9PEZI|nr:hypothetical protein B0H66DRAFT_542372 [Apodospora peruviana]